MTSITTQPLACQKSRDEAIRATKASLEDSITAAARSFSPAKEKGYAEHIVSEVAKSVNALRLTMGKGPFPLDEIRRIEEGSTGADYSRKFALRLAWRVLDVDLR